MNVVLRIAIILALTVGLTAGLAAWKYSHVNTEMQSQHVQEFARQQAALARHTVEAISQQTAEQLTRLAGEETSYRKSQQNYQRSAPLSPSLSRSDFYLVSLLKLNPQRVWHPEWTSASAQILRNWPPQYFDQVLAELPLARANKQNVIWSRVDSPGSQPLIAVMSAVRVDSAEAIVVGLLPMQYFAAFNQTVKSGSAELVIFDERGYALAYPEQQYVGARLDKHPVVAHALREQALTTHGRFTGLSGLPVLSAVERAQDSNLFVAVNLPEPKAGAGFWQFVGEIGLQSLALWLIALAVSAFVVLKVSRAYHYLRQVVVSLAADRPIRLPDHSLSQLLPLTKPLEALQKKALAQSKPEPQKTAEIKKQTVVEDGQAKANAYKRIASGLTAALRGPVAAILGHSQIARSKAGEMAPLKEHFTVIEREARQVREVLDSLEKLSGEQNIDKAKVDVTEVVLAALASLRGTLANHNIKVTKDLATQHAVNANAKQLQVVIEQILTNAIEAMDNVKSRQLTLSSKEKDGVVYLAIEDTGPGLSGDQLNRVFDPFYTTKNSDNNAGLGLTVAKGIVRAHQGDISVHSDGKSGTQFIIEMPSVAQERMAPVTGPDEFEKPEVPLPNTKSTRQNVETVKIGNSEWSAGGEPKAIEPDESQWQVTGPYKVKTADTLAGKAPITGSHAEKLPPSPAIDEVTFTGEIQPQQDSSAQEAQVTQTRDSVAAAETMESDVQLETEVEMPPALSASAGTEPEQNRGNSVDDRDSSDDENNDGDFQVAIRKPKVRVQN